MERLETIQRQIVPLEKKDSIQIAPVANLPIFIPIFQLFALIPPVESYILWSIINLVGFILYLSFFLRELNVPNRKLMVLLGLLSYPSFSNLFFGQVNLFLMICVGEFIRNNLQKRNEFVAGMWIGGLILKPQLLVLIIPIFLLQRKWRLLGGFALIVVTALTGSLLLGGIPVMLGVASMILDFSSGIPTNYPEYMMNWRMVGEQLDRLLPTGVSWAVVGLGMVGTLVVTAWMWRKPVIFGSTKFLVGFTGALAATLVFTWHSHHHMAMVMLPGILLLMSRQVFPSRLYNWWLFGYPLAVLFIFYPLLFSDVITYSQIDLLTCSFMFLFNLIFLGWAWKYLRSTNNIVPSS